MLISYKNIKYQDKVDKVKGISFLRFLSLSISTKLITYVQKFCGKKFVAIKLSYLEYTCI